MGSQIPQEKSKSAVGNRVRERWRKRLRKIERERETMKKMCAQSHKASWDM